MRHGRLGACEVVVWSEWSGTLQMVQTHTMWSTPVSTLAVPPTRRQSHTWWCAVGLIAVLDLVTKAIAVACLEPGAHIPWIGSLEMGWELTFNAGFAGGHYPGPWARAVNVVLTGGLVAAVGRIGWLFAALDRWALPGVVGIAGGAVGNLASLITSPIGVPDFLVVPTLPGGAMVVNVADLALWVGAVCLTVAVGRIVCRVAGTRMKSVDVGRGAVCRTDPARD